MKFILSGRVIVGAFFVSVFFLGSTSHAAGFLDDVTDTLSKAGDAISKTAGEVVDSAVEAGEDIGLLEKEEKEQETNSTSQAPATAKAPSPKTVEKLPGGVTSRIEKMYKELDKVEKKLITGVGSAEDRAKRAELDLKRARGYMDEIEKKYAQYYSSDNQVMTAAKNRLAEVHESWQTAMNNAGAPQTTGDQSVIAEKKEPVQEQKAVAAPTAKPTPTMAKLPGGVTSRIGKMDKELAKVEKKLTTGVGTPADRAQRAKLDLNRAEKYMKEIEQRYAEAYESGHPDMIAARDHLTTVREQWETALTIATEEDAERARIAEEKRKAEEEERIKIAEQEKQEQLALQSEKKSAQAACDEWGRKFDQYMGGDKGLMGYPTDDMQLLAKWRPLYNEAEATLKDYPRGLCGSADSTAQYLDKKIAEFNEFDSAAQKQMAQELADRGGFLFSTAPFDGPNSGSPQETFKAGDNIYGIIKLVKPLSEIYGKKKNFQVRIDVKIDGKKIHAQFVTVKSDDYGTRDYLVFNVAPKPSELKAYSDQNIEFGKSTPTTIQGPNELTFHLGNLEPGSHSIEFSMYYYGKTWAEGSFTIEGDNFGEYAELHQKIATGVVAGRTMPEAKMQNKKLEQEMIALLKNAGWDNVYRLNIVDKDWWIERVNGGNTPVKARYMAAAALTKKTDGSYCYKKCTFHQDKLITGAFGELYLSHQGDEVPINKENIDK